MEQKSEFRNSFEHAIARCYCHGEYEQAANYLEEIAPEYPQAYPFLHLIEKKRAGTVKSEHLIEFGRREKILSELNSAQDPISKHQNGLYYFLRKRYAEAVSCFKESGKLGDPYAQYFLGLCYAQGKGVEKNLELAAKCFHDAAVQRHEQAGFHLSMCCLDSEEIAKNYHSWFQEVVFDEKNSTTDSAWLHMGLCYFMGKGVEQSYKRAAELFLPIAVKGTYLQAQYLFAICCYNDPNVVENRLILSKFPSLSNFHTRRDKAYFLAEKYIRLAANAGSREAQYALGIFLLGGVGVQENFSKACEWFDRAGYRHPEAMIAARQNESKRHSKIKSITYDFAEQHKRLPEMLNAQRSNMKPHLDRMFAFEMFFKAKNTPDVVSKVEAVPEQNAESVDIETVLLEVNVTAPQSKFPENKPEAIQKQSTSFEGFVDALLDNIAPNSLPPMPEVKTAQTSQQESEVSLLPAPVVLIEAAPAKPEETLTQKQSTSEPTPQLTPFDSAPSVAAENKPEPKKKKEKKLKKKSGVVNDEKSESAPPPLSFHEAENLLNKANTKNLDAQEKERLKQWFDTENAINDNKNANSHYCLGLYWGYVAKNPFQAFRYYEKTAKLDPVHAGANYQLGLCYGEDGRSFNDNDKPMSRNIQKAFEHYQIAADNGYEQAQRPRDRLKKKIDEKQAQKKEAQEKAQLASLAQENNTNSPAMVSASPTQEAELLPVSEPSIPSLILSSDEVSPPNASPTNAAPESKSSSDEVVHPPLDQDAKVLPKKSKRPKSSEDKGRNTFLEGLKAYRLGRDAEARTKFKEANNLLGCLHYGVMLKEADSASQEAKDCFEKVRVSSSWFLKQLDQLEHIDQLGESEARKVYKNLIYLGLYCEFAADGSVAKLTKEKALDFYTLAVEKGCPNAENYLAKYHFRKQDYDNAALWFDKASAKDEPDAWYHLGLLHLNDWGNHGQENENSADDYFQKAAQKGHALAQYQLGLCYLEDDTPEDNQKAYEQFKLSAASGYLEAKCALAECLWYGCGVKADLPQAKQILSIVGIHSKEGKSFLNKLAEKQGNTQKEQSLKQFIVQLQKEINMVSSQSKSSSDPKSASSSIFEVPRTSQKKQSKPESKQSMTDQEIDGLLEDGMLAQEKETSERILAKAETKSDAQAVPEITSSLPALFSDEEIDKLLKDGIVAYESLKNSKVISIFEKIASREPVAYLYLGLIYESLRGPVRNDPQKARAFERKFDSFYAKARKHEESFATPEAGREFFSGVFYQFVSEPKDLKKAHDFYTIAAKNESGLMKLRAEYNLADICKNAIQRLALFGKIANNGYVAAQVEVGLDAGKQYVKDSHNYQLYKPEAKSYRKTLEFLQKAIDQGHLGAACLLGKFLYDAQKSRKEKDRDYATMAKYFTMFFETDKEDAQKFLVDSGSQKAFHDCSEAMTRISSSKPKEPSKQPLVKAEIKSDAQAAPETTPPLSSTVTQPQDSSISDSKVSSSEPVLFPDENIDPEKLFKQGEKAFELCQYKSALSCFLSVGTRYPATYIYLGRMFAEGKGVVQNFNKAGEYFGKAKEAQQKMAWFSQPGRTFLLGLYTQYVVRDAKQVPAHYQAIINNKTQSKEMRGRAQYYLGSHYQFEGNPAQASSCYKEGIKNDSLLAQFAIGFVASSAYLTLSSNPQSSLDVDKIWRDVDCLRKAADKGHLDAQCRFAEVLYSKEKNKKGDKDYTKVIKLLNSAAAHDHVGAQYFLGKCYLESAVPADYLKAKDLLGKAWRAGHPEAFALLQKYKAQIQEQQEKLKSEEKVNTSSNSETSSSVSTTTAVSFFSPPSNVSTSETQVTSSSLPVDSENTSEKLPTPGT